MRLIELFRKQAIALDVSAASKDEVLDTLVNLQCTHGSITDPDAYKAAIYAREAEFSTYVGDGIAVPHAKSDVVRFPSLAVVRLKAPILYNEDDEDKSDLFVMIAAPKDGDLHVDILARLMTLLSDETFTAKLRTAKDAAEFLRMIDAEETRICGKDELNAASCTGGYRILAVTACPNGIAHTYMAAENLQKAAEKRGISIKVETNGSGGTKNLLTAEEIANCDGIIVAADKNVAMERFAGKPVMIARVSDGIHKPDALLDAVLSKKAPIYHASKTAVEAPSGSIGKQSFGGALYKHLMNGVSHMLPFVIGGGILIAIAFLLDDYSINPSNFGMNTPVAAFFKTIGGAAFDLMLPVLAAFIAMSIADRPGLAVGFVGGVLAKLGTSFSSLTGSADAVSGGFLAALLAGFAAGYLTLGLEKATEKFPKAMDGIRPMLIYPLLGIGIIGAFMLAVNPLMAAINTGIASLLDSMGGTSKVLLGTIVGGMMAIDMGGPFNKAAYAFGIAGLANGNYEIMASVMIGGMVPPLVIALSTTFFPKKWTKEERSNGYVNYIMGLCFISEGAIPYAASDPLRVIPSCFAGAAVSGALSMAFGCTLMAPHGGIFVLPTIGNPALYALSLVIGSVIGALLLSLLKKKKS